MANADEDLPLQPSTSSQSQSLTQPHDHDLSDETQDFRFLNSIINNTSNSSASIPKRGEKDFEPNATQSQATSLAASRYAMHAALSHPRLHQVKGHVVGEYCPPKDLSSFSHIGVGVASPFGNEYTVKIANAHGVYFRTIGRADSRNRMWLLPEEALYLIERGSLDIRWPKEEGDQQESEEIGGNEHDDGGEGREDKNEEVVDSGVGQDKEGNADIDEAVGDLPMSLQGAYATFIGKSGLTLERYSVFSGLRRLGYTVTRAPTWATTTTDAEAYANGHATSYASARQEQSMVLNSRREQETQNSNEGGGILGLINRLVRYLFQPSNNTNSKSCPSFGPLVAPGLYRSYNDIYRALSLIPYEDPSRLRATGSPLQQESTPQPPFCITYHVWKPSTPYRKSDPPKPDFRVAVIDARETNVPTMEEIGRLLDSMPEDEVPKERPLEQRLKHGKRNVILAVVDMGVVSYLRFSDAGFGGEKLFENKSRNMRKWKRGGGGQRGRGGKKT